MANPPVVRRVVSSPLAQYVDCLWIQCAYRQPHSRERVLPSGAADVVFAVDCDGRARSSIAGPRSTFVDLATSQAFSAIGIHFKPGGASPFFGLPVAELENQHVTLDVVWGDFAATVADRLWSAGAAEDRFNVLEEALKRRMHQPRGRHAAVQYAVKLFERSRGVQSVASVADELGISSRRLLEVFREEVGLAPKTFSRVRRFNAILGHLERAAEIDWTDVALSCGYCDQAHFNHDFRAFSGVNPSTYLQHHTSKTHVAIR
jgi:AraC-like DNA-binding protein